MSHSSQERLSTSLRYNRDQINQGVPAGPNASKPTNAIFFEKQSSNNAASIKRTTSALRLSSFGFWGGGLLHLRRRVADHHAPFLRLRLQDHLAVPLIPHFRDDRVSRVDDA